MVYPVAETKEGEIIVLLGKIATFWLQGKINYLFWKRIKKGKIRYFSVEFRPKGYYVTIQNSKKLEKGNVALVGKIELCNGNITIAQDSGIVMEFPSNLLRQYLMYTEAHLREESMILIAQKVQSDLETILDLFPIGGK